jgi:hypothetical protein
LELEPLFHLPRLAGEAGRGRASVMLSNNLRS